MKKTASFFFILCFFSIHVYGQQVWEELTAKADSLDSKRAYAEALVFREQALEKATNQPESIRQELQALQMFSQAEHYFWKTKRPDGEAYLLMQNAIEMFEEAGTDAERISKAYRRLAENAFDFMFLPNEAEVHLESAFEYYEKSTKKDTLFLADMLDFSGFMKIMKRQFPEVIELSEHGLKLMDQVSASPEEISARKHKFLYNLSLVYGLQFLNQPIKEYQYTVEAEKVQSLMKDPDIEGLVMTYRKLALFERNQTNYNKAAGYMDKAWEVYRLHEEELRKKVGLKLEFALANASQTIHNGTQNESNMLDLLNKMETLSKNPNLDEVEKANFKGFLNHSTNFYTARKWDSDLEKAKKLNERALSIRIDESKAPYSLSSFHLTAQYIQIQIAFWEKNYSQVLQLISAITRPAQYADVLMALKAETLLILGRKDEANDVIHDLLVFLHPDNKYFNFPGGDVEPFKPGSDISFTQSLTQLAQSYRQFYGEYSMEEEKLYWMALMQFEKNIYSNLLTKKLKGTYDEICAGLMEAALHRGFSVNEHNALLTFMESLTSQDLVHNFLLKREIAGGTDLYQLVEKEQHIRSLITYLKKEQQKKDDDTIRQQLFEHELELSRVKEELTNNYKQAGLFTIPTIDIQAQTNKNIIRFSVADNALFKARLYEGKMTYKKIDDFIALKKDIEEYLGMIGQLGTPISIIKEKGAALFTKLFDDDFETTARTIIIPDDILHYLPFELLVHEGEYLIKKHIISYATNFYFLKGETSKNSGVKKDQRGRQVAFFAPQYSEQVPNNLLAVRGTPYSLTGAADEVNEIAHFISGQVYQGKSASKSKFKALEGNISVLHLAMHSNLNDHDPELSHLLFSNEEEDYEMYISELYGMNFRADLAVLSACNTGVGGFGDGGNMVSMHHAFTTAGIPSTVASLWNAPDASTKKIMIDFYHNLRDGQDKATALRKAKLDYLNDADENLQHPFYWAAFVLSGDDSPIELTSPSIWKSRGLLITTLSLVILAGIGIGVARRKRLKLSA